ncbi:MAG: biotin--[acetyl-CoA-carboxylase] ligase [Candidatus Muiribacteriota bacterium]
MKKIEIPHILLEKTTSTKEVAKKIEVDCPFFAVAALEQTCGRGRFEDRKWFSPPKMGVYLSLLCRQTDSLSVNALNYITKSGVLSVLDSFLNICDLKSNIEIKYPNDLLIEKKKVAGVLADSRTKGEKIQNIIFSTGINIIKPENMNIPENSGFLNEFVSKKLLFDDIYIELINSVIKNFISYVNKMKNKNFDKIDEKINNFLLY